MSDVPAGYYKHLDPEHLKYAGSVLGPLGSGYSGGSAGVIAFVDAAIEAKARKRRKKKSLPSKLRPQLLERDGNKCHYGRAVMRQPTIEHVVPRSLGGGNEIANLVLACADCNSSLGSQLDKCECNFCVAAQKRYGL